MKKWISFALCVVLTAAVFLFGACINNNKPPEVTNDLRFDENGAPIFFDENNDGITLRVWSVISDPDDAYLEMVNKMFNDWYRNDGVQAEVTPVDTNLFYTQLSNTINTDPKNAPDVIIFHSERLTSLVDQQIIVSMDETFSFLGDYNTFSKENYLENVLAECVVDGTMYGVPLDVHSGIWYTRRDIIEKNGLTVPSNKAEFENVCKVLMERKAAGTLWVRSLDELKQGIDNVTSGDAQAIENVRNNAWKQVGPESDFYPVEMSPNDNIESGWIPQSAILQNGGKLSNPDGTPAWEHSEGLLSFLNMIDGWSGKYIGANRSGDTLWANFGSGNAIFACEGPWWAEQRLNEYDKYLGVGGMGVLSLSNLYADDPNNADAHKIYGVGHAFAITNSQRNASATRRVAGALYAQFMTENAVKYTTGGHIPACKSVLNSEEYTSSAAYNRYLKYMGQPQDYVMLGNTKYFSDVYEQLKVAYRFTLSPNRDGTPADHIAYCYKSAMDSIRSKQGL